MSWLALISLLVACGALMLIERMGVPTTLALKFKGDVKRETRWLAQYGQAVCSAVAALLVWKIDALPAHAKGWLVIATAVIIASLVALVLKRVLGRVRPGRELAGQFLGPTFKHANFRESFPSSHSACAVALSVVLAAYYPSGGAIFWTLAITCATLRYIMDAHWPSDVFGGIALGYASAYAAMALIK